MIMERQLARSFFLIRPSAFGYNHQTADDNSFQTRPSNTSYTKIHSAALAEFNVMLEKLNSYELEPIVFEDAQDPFTPDAIFPNNWISTHDGGIIVTYPMWSEIRRKERSEIILDFLEYELSYTRRYSFEYLEDENFFLEGTGSMVLDRPNKLIYAGLSNRTSIKALDKFAVLIGYRAIHFHTSLDNKPVYHTNVMLSIASDYAVVCPQIIREENEQKMLLDTLKRSGRSIIEIEPSQMQSFAGNVIQLENKRAEAVTLMSDTAMASFKPDQMDIIRNSGPVVSLSIPTIEKYGGGSVRCMIAELF